MSAPSPLSDYGLFRTSKVVTALRKTYGVAWNNALGFVADYLLLVAKKGVQARFPGRAPPDSIETLGDERELERGLNEDDPTYAERIRTAWDAWLKGGTGEGVARSLVIAGYPNLLVQQQRRLDYSIDGSGNLVIHDRGFDAFLGVPTSFWSRFVVLLYPPFPWGAAPNPPDGSDYQQRARALVRKWKPGFATCISIIVVGDGGLTWDTFPPAATWDVQLRASWDSGAAPSSRVVWTA